MFLNNFFDNYFARIQVFLKTSDSYYVFKKRNTGKNKM